MADHLYALATKVNRLQEIRKKYNELPRDPERVIEFLRFSYQNPRAFFPQTRQRRHRMAERIFQQAKNLDETSVRNIAELVQTFRDHNKKTAMYGGLWHETEAQGPVHAPKTQDMMLIYATQGILPVAGRKEHVFTYGLHPINETIFSAEFNLDLRNNELSKQFGIPVRTYKGNPGTL
jgi:hypothetical protein